MEFLGQIWAVLWETLLNILVAINSVVGLPGISIIIFTLLMRLLTVPLTVKSLRSSRNMQQIQPLIKEVQRKYPKDKAKQQEATMKLYHEYGINPAASCFPMLIQMPIFFGLLSALRYTLDPNTTKAALQNILWVSSWVPAANFSQPFLWVQNLAKADPFYIWPLLSGLFQFIQSRMQMPRRDPNQPLDGQQKMMNNMMQFMPLYIIVISIGFPAGTVIYWAFSSLFGAVQQYFITGFGTLPDLPGMGWLPHKPTNPPAPAAAPLPGATKRKGVMSWMMDKALEAQEVKKAAEGQPLRISNGLKVGQQEELGAGEQENDGATTVRVKSKGSYRPAKNTPRAARYSSEEGASGNGNAGGSGNVYGGGYSNGNGNGKSDGVYSGDAQPSGPTQLPRKKRSKR